MLPTDMPSWSASIAYFFASIFFILITIMYYEKIRRQCLGIAPNENNLNEPPSQRQSVGLASTDIHSLPAIQLQEDFKKYSDRGNMDCAVCLGEFVEGEWMRLLPSCGHVFHVSCINTWFVSRSTCPLCRTNVLYESCQEKDMGRHISDSRMMENREVGHAVEIESDKSVSSELGGSGNRITTENSRGETSRSATNVQVMSISPTFIG